MEDKIVIEEGGMRFVMEKTPLIGCDNCKNTDGIMSICALCMDDYSPQLICTSAKKITEEPKVYGAWNMEEAKHLVGRDVEFHNGATSGTWMLGTLESIGDVNYPFGLIGGELYFFAIRELELRKLTWKEIKAQYPELGDVELVGGGDGRRQKRNVR